MPLSERKQMEYLNWYLKTKNKESMLKFTTEVPDYEHSGDLQHEIAHIKQICPEATDFNSWEEEDYEAESEYESEYGECEESIYRGFVSFKAPKECKEQLEKAGYYVTQDE